MSTELARIWALDLPNSLKLVLLAIGEHAGVEGSPTTLSGEVLSAQCSIDKHHISRIIGSLEKRGLISVERRPTEVNVYRVTLREAQSVTPGLREAQSTSTGMGGAIQGAAPPPGGQRPAAAALSAPSRALPSPARSRPTVIARSNDEAVLWHTFDALCGVIPDNASVRWQTIRLKACKDCMTRRISIEDLEAAADRLGMQPGYGAGEQALIHEVLDARGLKPAYGQPMFKKPDRAEKASEGLRMFREARSGGE